VVDTGAAAVAEAEDSMVDTPAVAIEVGTLEDSTAGILAVDTMLLLYLEDTLVDTEVGIMVGIVGDTMAVIEVDTMEGSMVEVFTHIGDYGDGDLGDGLFWDGPMQIGPTFPMEDIRI
jgi:hypothetical protein